MPCKDSDHPAHSRSLIGIFADAFWIDNDAKLLHADGDGSD